MDGTPRLLTDVRFSERRRGYDPEEVDNFLEKVSSAVAQLQDKLRQATARAEDADARLADALRARDLAQHELSAAHAALAEGPAPSSAPPAPAIDPAAEAEQASVILRMAQRTADAAVEEARTKALAIVRDAELDADRVQAEARRAADAAVHDLEHHRDQLQGDVELLQVWLDDQRRRLRSGIDALQRLVDDPASLRPVASPTLASPPTPTPPLAPAPPAPPALAVEAGPPTQAVPAAELLGDDDPEVEQAPADHGPVPAPPPAPSGEVAEGHADELFSPPAPPAPPGPADADPLGVPDADADAAMRAFFETDFDEGDDRRRGRRRR